MFHEHHLRVERTARYVCVGAERAERAEGAEGAEGAEEGAAREVWFVLHGYGQLAARFLRHFTGIADASRLVVAPEALNRFYLAGPESAPAAERPVGATWMTREDRESEIADYVDYLDALADAVLASADRASLRVVVLGFSQGAATASRWVAQGRTQVARLVLWGGLPAAELEGGAGSEALRGTPVTLVVGTRDQYVTPERAGEIEARLRAGGVDVALVTFDGGHVVDRPTLSALAAAGR